MLAAAPEATDILTVRILAGSEDVFRGHPAPDDDERIATASTVGLTAEYADQKTNRRVIFWLQVCVRLSKARELGAKRRI